MGVLDVPKAMYKAQQAKNKMTKIKAAGKNGAVGVLVNGVNELEEVEIYLEEVFDNLDIDISEEDLKKLARMLAKNFKKAMNDAKKKLEKEMMNSTDLEELKGLLGG